MLKIRLDFTLFIPTIAGYDAFINLNNKMFRIVV